MVYHAAARGIVVDSVRSSLEGDIDLQGFLGLDSSVRKGFQGIRVRFDIETNATREQMTELMQFSPIHDVVANPVPVHLEVRTTPRGAGR
jgi:hypothetical protein